MDIFKDLKVVELASVLAGPSVGMFFAELGAEVLKFENKNVGGDVTRNWKIASESEDSISAYFSSVNYKKTYHFVDYHSEKDMRLVLDNISEADIVICNFKEGYAEKFGLDYQQLKQNHPGLIYAQLNGFKSHPERVAFDVVLQAECGYMFMNGQSDGPATKLPLAFMDILAAHQLKEGILAALYKRALTGKGSLVSTSLEESAIASLANQASNYLMAGHIPQRIGSLHPNIAPYGEIFETADKALVVLAIGSDRQFSTLCRLISSNIDQEDRFRHNSDRVIHRSDLAQLLQPMINKMNAAQFIQICLDHHIPVGKVKDMKEVFENSTAHSMVLEETISGQQTKRVKSVAFNLLD